MPSPFAPYQNALLRFQVASNTLVLDSHGNSRPAAAIVECRALLEQKQDLNRDYPPGVDPQSVRVAGYITEVSGDPNLLTLPSVITPDSLCAVTWQGRAGQFWLEFTADNPYLKALNIDLVNRIRGYFVPNSLTITGDPYTPLPTAHREVITATLGQTIFSLGYQPAEPNALCLFINGSKAVIDLHYTVNGSILTWLATDMILAPDDRIEVIYD